MNTHQTTGQLFELFHRHADTSIVAGSALLLLVIVGCWRGRQAYPAGTSQKNEPERPRILLSELLWEFRDGTVMDVRECRFLPRHDRNARSYMLMVEDGDDEGMYYYEQGMDEPGLPIGRHVIRKQGEKVTLMAESQPASAS